MVTALPAFSYDDPAKIQLYLHMAVDSGRGTGVASDGADHRPPEGWEVVLTTDDGATPRDNSTSLEFYDTSVGVPTMQATAYRNLATGEIVVAYRGTDDPGELEYTSIPLGGGISEAEDPSVITESYLQEAYDFYRYALENYGGGDRSLVSFTGSSLGGIVAGVMGAISNLPALTSATGPHSLAIENLVPLLVLHPDEAALTPDASGVFNLRITGEILNDAVELVRTLVNAAQVAGDLGLLSDEDAAAIDALDAKFGDGVRVGTNLPELDAGEAFSSSLLNGILSGDITDSILLHYAASHAFQFHAQGVLGYSAYKSVDGFSRAFYDPSLWGLAYSDVSSALSDLTASVLDGRSDILTPLLFDAEFRLSVVDAVYFGPNYISETGQSVITTTLSKMAVEYAYQQVSFGGDYGPIMTLDEAGWLTIDPLAMFDGAQYSSVFTEFYAFLMPGLAGAVAPDIDLIHVQAAQTTGDLALGDENDLVLAGNGDHFINTGGGDDVIQTGEAADFIRAGTGDDFVLSAAGAQQINGDGGNDWLSYARSDLGVYVELFEGFGIGGHAEGDLITGVENLIGSDFDDTFYGDDVANIFFGGAGFDVEYGNGGDDVFVFLGGSDTDVIGDFTTGDKVLIDSALASEFDELLEFGDDIDGNAVFAFDTGETLGFYQVTLDQLDVEAFYFT